MRFLELFDCREWESFDFYGIVEDGRLTDKAVVYGCFLVAGIGYAFGA